MMKLILKLKKKLKKKILKKYKTISSIKDASISELEEILPHDVAKNFYDYIRKEDV